MRRSNDLSRTVSSAAIVLLCVAASGCRDTPQIEPVADFGDRQCTGVAVTGGGRIFVNFPRWSHAHGVSVVEVKPDGTIRPFPDERWNRWAQGEDPKERFVCVQSVFADPRDPGAALWVLDAGSPRFEGVVPNAAKLVQVDLAADRVVRVVRFDSKIAPRDSYLNDVRVDAERGFAYITDSGRGALVIVNLKTNRSRRVLDGHPSTRSEAGVAPVIGGREWRFADGTVPQVHADAIALSADKKSLYYKALTGRTLYRLDTIKLRNFSLPDSKLAEAVESLGRTVVCDGIAADRRGDLYLTALEQDAIVVRRPDGTLETVLADARIRWADSLAISPGGDLYFTVSQIHLSPRFNEGADRRTEPYMLYRVPGGAAPEGYGGR